MSNVTNSRLPKLPDNYVSGMKHVNLTDNDERLRRLRNKSRSAGAIGFDHMAHKPFSI